MADLKPRIVWGGQKIDDRGYVSYVNEFNFHRVKRFYLVENHQSNFVRAWHGHQKEWKYVLVVQGSIMMGVAPLDGGEPQKFFLSSRSPGILCIPEGYTNGFMTLEPDTKIMFFSTSTLEESSADDIRWPWDYFDKNGNSFWKVEPR